MDPKIQPQSDWNKSCHACGHIWVFDARELVLYALVGELDGAYGRVLEVVTVWAAHDGAHDFRVGVAAD